MQILQIFLTIKTPCSGRQATAYTVPVAALILRSFKVNDFLCHLKANIRLSISDQ